MKNPTDCPLTKGHVPGHSLTWGNLLREFIFLIWDQRQLERFGHTPHDCSLGLRRAGMVVTVLEFCE